MFLSLLSFAIAAPPSSVLTGANGTLAWTVRPTATGLLIDGTSPGWTVHHVAGPDLRPIRTERQDAADNAVIVDYSPQGAVVRRAGRVTTITGTDIWDGDTVDIRLGDRVAQGMGDVTFRAVDPASGSLYGFQAKTVASEKCGLQECVHVHLAMTGIYRIVGPSWEYWFGADGRLLRFEGPIGTFAAPGAS